MRSCNCNSKFVALFAINFFITFCFSVNDSLFSLYYRTYSVNGLVLGLAFTLYSLSKIIIAPVTGRLLDKIGSCRVLFYSITLYFIVACSFYFITDSVVILVIRICQGIACALFRPVMYYMLGDDSGLEKGRVFGAFDMSFYSAVALAPLAGGFIVKMWGFRAIFAIMMLCCFMAMFIYYVNHASLTRSHDSCVSVTAVSGNAYGHAHDPVSINMLMFYIFCRGFGISVLTVFLPIYLADINVDIASTGIILFTATACTAFFLPLTGMLADVVNKEHLIASGGMIVSAILIILTQLNNFVSIISVVALSGFFSALSQPACSSLMIEQTEKCHLGLTLGRFNSYMGLGFACGPIFGASIYRTMGISAVFGLSGVLGIIASGLFFFNFRPKCTDQTEC